MKGRRSLWGMGGIGVVGGCVGGWGVRVVGVEGWCCMYVLGGWGVVEGWCVCVLGGGGFRCQHTMRR